VTDVAARDNGVFIVLTDECAGGCAVCYDAVVAWSVVLAHEMSRAGSAKKKRGSGKFNCFSCIVLPNGRVYIRKDI
jgi:hypothetical protein